MSFGMLFSLEPSIAGLKDKYSTQSSCTIGNSQYSTTNSSGTKIYYCVINNEVFRAPDGTYGGSVWAGRKGAIGKQESNQYGTYEWAIEGNKLVEYKCKNPYGCSGQVQRYVQGYRR